MATQEKIDIEIFKIVPMSITGADNMEVMALNMAQLLVGMLRIKGCNVFVFNPGTDELEIMGSFGLSRDYVHKGPLFLDKSVGCKEPGKTVVISDISKSSQLQYPENAKNEGITAIVSVPVVFEGRVTGCLRLYDDKIWEVSEQEQDTLIVFAENVGLAMMYTRILHSFNEVRNMVNEAHSSIHM